MIRMSVHCEMITTTCLVNSRHPTQLQELPSLPSDAASALSSLGTRMAGAARDAALHVPAWPDGWAGTVLGA